MVGHLLLRYSRWITIVVACVLIAVTIKIVTPRHTRVSHQRPAGQVRSSKEPPNLATQLAAHRLEKMDNPGRELTRTAGAPTSLRSCAG
jgi:flagellar basal body-associated protein FliL